MRRFRIFHLSHYVTANITVCFTTLFFNVVNFLQIIDVIDIYQGV